MGLEIVVNSLFTNANLLTVPVLGFSDNFNRANSASLGLTSKDQKQWMLTGQIKCSIDGNQAVVVSTTGRGGALVDAGSPNGTFRATFVSAGAAAGPGLALRSSITGRETLWLHAGMFAGNLHYALFTQSGTGGKTLLQEATSKNAAAGDVITAVLAGSSVKVSVNGAELISTTDPKFTAQTLFGIFGDGATVGARWDDISFTAA